MSARGTVCLMYHEIELPGRELADPDPGYTRYAVSLASFREQMQFLKSAGTPGLNVTQMLAGAQGVALTFDDGCETDLITAAPLLQGFGFQATFYITVGFLDKRGFMSRQQARDLGDTGFEIGCHSLTHPYLTDLDAAGLVLEIAGAKKQLEDIMGRKVTHYSCPGGRWDERVVQVARHAGYESVATSQVGVNRHDSNRFALARNAVTRDLGLADFQALASGTGLWSKQLRGRTLQLVQRAMGNTAYNRLRSAFLGRMERQ